MQFTLCYNLVSQVSDNIILRWREKMQVIFDFIYALSAAVFNLMKDIFTGREPIVAIVFYAAVIALIIVGAKVKFVHFITSVATWVLAAGSVFCVTENNYHSIASGSLPLSLATVMLIAFFSMTFVFYYPVLISKLKGTLGPIGAILVCIFIVVAISIGVIMLVQLLLNYFDLAIAPYVLLVVYALMGLTVPSTKS